LAIFHYKFGYFGLKFGWFCQDFLFIYFYFGAKTSKQGTHFILGAKFQKLITDGFQLNFLVLKLSQRNANKYFGVKIQKMAILSGFFVVVKIAR